MGSFFISLLDITSVSYTHLDVYKRQQLEYIIAVDNYRHFSKAAEASFVTQPTLSMMIQKLEEELEVKIFDRSQLPVQPTEIGRRIIDQARVAVAQVNRITEIVHEEKGIVKGVLDVYKRQHVDGVGVSSMLGGCTRVGKRG